MLIREIIFRSVPVLMVAAILLAGARKLGLVQRFGARSTVVASVLGLLIVLVPVGRLSLADLFLTLSPSVSVTSCVLVLTLFWRQAGGGLLLDKGEVILLSGFNVVVSLSLFSSTLGFIRADIYALGYGFSPVALSFTAVTVLCVFFRTRLGSVFVACLGAHALSLYPSGNLFDSLTDGFAFLLCASLLVAGLTGRPRVFSGAGSEDV